ncbi:hypothetical protein [Bacillus pumilus]|uniref:hypothetical protein n=1 Tax=Bacillus pumilus TaxID=1408 RepID=UPI0011A05699|nr:hypothetical protein [Bacillus pumilus]
MSKEEMKMSIEDIKNAMLHPDLIKHLYGVKINDSWGNVDGRQLVIDVYKMCEEYECIKKEIEELRINSNS